MTESQNPITSEEEAEEARKHVAEAQQDTTMDADMQRQVIDTENARIAAWEASAGKGSSDQQSTSSEEAAPPDA